MLKRLHTSDKYANILHKAHNIVDLQFEIAIIAFPQIRQLTPNNAHIFYTNKIDNISDHASSLLFTDKLINKGDH